MVLQEIACKNNNTIIINYDLCVSRSNIYEFAKLFINKSSDNIGLGKTIFSYFNRIMDKILIIEDIYNLIKADLEYMNSGKIISIFLGEEQASIERAGISNLAKGIVSDEMINFVKSRENEMKLFSLKHKIKIKESCKNEVIPLNYSDYRDDKKIRLEFLHNCKYSNIIKELSENVILSEQNKYPFLNAWVNANLYQYWESCKNHNYLVHNSTYDFRHLIISKVADCFITNDKRILKIGNSINPYIKIADMNSLSDLSQH